MGRKKAAKKRQAAAERKRYRLSQPEAGDNPFSLRVTRTKHDVLGQQQKGRVGKRGQSREQGVKLRERTLLVEHKQKHKSNTFRDKRIGEYDAVCRLKLHDYVSVALWHCGCDFATLWLHCAA